MNDLPGYIGLVFLATTIATISFLFFAVRLTATNTSKKISLITLMLLSAWMLSTFVLARSGFFHQPTALPPRMFFGFLPPLLTIVCLLVIPQSRRFMERIPITVLTYTHIIRVPVEMVLWWLATYEVAPYLLTFEGVNYDILSGVTAPFVAIFFVGVKRKNRIAAMMWNVAALGLLINVVGHAVLSIPSPIQAISFDQPMLAVLHPPYIWLPTVVVPIVLWSHMVGLLQLIRNEDSA